MHKCLVWFRNDLRIQDNLTIQKLLERGSTLMPIFIINEEIGSASKFWLSESLESLNRQLGDCLSSFSGSAAKVIEELIKENSITEITWNRGFDRKSLSDEVEVKKIAKKYNVKVFVYNSSLLLAPEQTLKKDGAPFRVFTPFYKNNYLDLSFSCSNVDIEELNILSVKSNSKVENVRKNLMPKSNWHKKFNKLWQPGEDGAIMKLKKFIEQGLIGYGQGRNRPDLKHVSMLSPHIHFGEISPSRIAYALQKIDTIDKEKFYTELVWREFSHNLLFYFPHITDENLQEKFNKFEWRSNQAELSLWQEGATGIPIVDAGMRQLWAEGYMHNRVRMIVGSFLVKNLLHHWKDGRDWFSETLVDADIANNNASWQWVAGTGVDASPYFRIFNPITQSQKFDPQGEYIKKYIPELSRLPETYIHEPWACPTHILKQESIQIGTDYPRPMVDLRETRERALETFYMIKK
tara:strand:- start:61 stop:1452 length:1392 start_codon:yes stop_codon:yes gene_type:complete